MLEPIGTTEIIFDRSRRQTLKAKNTTNLFIDFFFQLKILRIFKFLFGGGRGEGSSSKLAIKFLGLLEPIVTIEIIFGRSRRHTVHEVF